MFNYTTSSIIQKCEAVVERYDDLFRARDILVYPTKKGAERKIRFQQLIMDMKKKHPVQNFVELYAFYKSESSTSRLISYLEDTLVGMAGLTMPHWTHAGRHTIMAEKLAVLDRFYDYANRIIKASDIEKIGDTMLMTTNYRFSTESIQLLCKDILDEYDYECRALVKSFFNEPTVTGIERKIRFLEIVAEIPNHRSTEIFLKLHDFYENEPKNSRLIRILGKHLLAFAGLQIPRKNSNESSTEASMQVVLNQFNLFVEGIKKIDQLAQILEKAETTNGLRASNA